MERRCFAIRGSGRWGGRSQDCPVNATIEMWQKGNGKGEGKRGFVLSGAAPKNCKEKMKSQNHVVIIHRARSKVYIRFPTESNSDVKLLCGGCQVL